MRLRHGPSLFRRFSPTMLIPLILSGGSGTRLWPVSREAHPKPFIKLADGRSLLQKTVDRLSALKGIAEVVTVTNRDHYFITRDEYAAGEAAYRHFFVLEPCARNTAAAVAAGALAAVARHGSDATLLVLPADHLVDRADAFAVTVGEALELGTQGSLVTFGIPPTYAETGFGYIERGDPIPRSRGFKVARFTEKPSADVAQKMVKSGRYLWNSGMFCFRAATFLEELGRYAPAVLEGCKACWEAAQITDERADLPPDLFAALPDISVDYAVMEKSERVAVVPAGFAWSDIGSWKAVSELVAPDAAGNRAQGECLFVDSENCYVQSSGRMVAAVGVSDLVIVDTPDALLVTDREHVQDVKKAAQQLKLANHETHKLHRTVLRPWGSYTVLEEGPGFKIKRIVVKPNASLSLQMHYHRSEHWVVVSGTARVTNGEKELLVRTNESTFIPAGHKHRLENPGRLDLVMIEVQSGGYLGEDDIVRFEDRYGRS
jgi:mannose-1-phosphate guanylyltransferase / mannose-6-phosphate isomerase